MAELHHGVSIELRFVHDHETIPDIGNGGFGYLNIAIVVVEELALSVDGADSENAVARFEVAQKIHRRFAGHGLIALAYNAAGKNDFEISSLAESGRDGYMIGNDSQVTMIDQSIGHRLCRRPDVDENRCAIRYVTGNQLADELFLARVAHLSIGISEGIAARW